MDGVLRAFLAQAEGFGPTPDGATLAGAVRDLALDADYWKHQIVKADGASRSLHRSPHGVQVALARRTDGAMSYVHSHRVWVALSAVAGVETHRRYDVERHGDDRATAVLAEERRLCGGAGDVVTLLPPLDVHSHGHVRGSGDWPWTVIVLGDDQLRFEREEFDLASGHRRALAPGDRGTLDLPDPQR